MRIKAVGLKVASSGLVIAAVIGADPVVVWAVAAEPPQDLNTVLNNLTTAIVGVLSALATLFLTIGGVLYLIAGGDPEQVKRAKSALRNAAIGYSIAVLAPLLLALLKQIVGQQ